MRVWDLHSRYTTSIAKHPPYRNAERFVDWLRSYVQQNDIRVIIPSEGFLIAIRACFQDFAHLVPFGPSAETIYRGLSKYAIFSTLYCRTRTPAGICPQQGLFTIRSGLLRTMS